MDREPRLSPEPRQNIEDGVEITFPNSDKQITLFYNGKKVPCIIKYNNSDKYNRYGGWALELKIPARISRYNSTPAFALMLQYSNVDRMWSIVPDQYFTPDLIDNEVSLNSMFTGNVGGENSSTYDAQRRKDAASKELKIFMENFGIPAKRAMLHLANSKSLGQEIKI